MGAIGGNCGQMGANVPVEFENIFLIGGIFFPNWGQLRANGGKCVSGIGICCFNWGIFLIGRICFYWGQIGANVLVEFENVFLIGDFFYWGHFFIIGGKYILKNFPFFHEILKKKFR